MSRHATAAEFESATRADELAQSTKRLNDRSRRARRAARAAAKGHARLEAHVEAWCVVEAEQHTLALAHNAAEHEGDDALIEAADAAWQPALDAMGAAALAIRDLPIASAAEALAKHAAFNAVSSVYKSDDEASHIAALQRDLSALAVFSPAPPAHELSPTVWDAAVVAQLAADDRRLIELDAPLAQVLAELTALAQRSGPLRKDDPALAEVDAEIHKANDRLAAIESEMRGLCATTVAGLRPKLRLADYWRIYDPDCDEIDSLLRDAMTMFDVPRSEPEPCPLSLFEEYERLGGRLTAMLDAEGQPMVGVKLAPPSTRARELETGAKLFTKDVFKLALDAYGLQPSVQPGGAMNVRALEPAQ